MVHKHPRNSRKSVRGQTSVWAALFIVFAAWSGIWFITLGWGKAANGSLVGFAPFLAGAVLFALCTVFVMVWRPTDPDSEHSTLGNFREALAVMRDLLIVIVLGGLLYAWARASIGTSPPAIEVHDAMPMELFQPWPR